MAIFHSYVSHYQGLNPIKSHNTTMFLGFFPWFSYVFLWFSNGLPPCSHDFSLVFHHFSRFPHGFPMVFSTPAGPHHSRPFRALLWAASSTKSRSWSVRFRICSFRRSKMESNCFLIQMLHGDHGAGIQKFAQGGAPVC